MCIRVRVFVSLRGRICVPVCRCVCVCSDLVLMVFFESNELRPSASAEGLSLAQTCHLENGKLGGSLVDPTPSTVSK
jgi:hypothetical protein